MKLIQDHKSYVKLFRDLARFHKKINHSDSEVHFARMNLSAHPVLAREDIKEFLQGMKNKLKFPALLLNTYSGKPDSNDSHDAKRKVIQGEFFILDRYHKDNYDMQEDVFDDSEKIGEEIISFLGEYYEEHPEQGVFLWSEGMSEKISNLEFDNLAGTKFYFTIDIPYQVGYNFNSDAFHPEMFEEESE